MKHIDILIHVLTLLSGIVTALLGYLLYLKYRFKAIRYYSLFIFATTLTVTATTLNAYFSYFINAGQGLAVQIAAYLLFEVFLIFINYALACFALAIINKPFTLFNKAFAVVPCLLFLITVILLLVNGISSDGVMNLPGVSFCFTAILFMLFSSFAVYIILIAINLKKIVHPDLKRALKVLALCFSVFIPIQAVILSSNSQVAVIMLSRNIFYLTVNTISIIFAAKYFFIKTPSIMDTVNINNSFMEKYSITKREKEVIGLILSGLSIKETSVKLDRSFKTVNNHIYNIYKKTGVGNKMELLNLIKENQI